MASTHASMAPLSIGYPVLNPNTHDELHRRTRYVGSILFLTTASFLLAKTARDALYFQNDGIFGSLLVLPTVLVGLVPLTLSTAAVGARATLRLAEGGLKSSIHRVSWEQSYLLVGPTQRAAAKLLVDGAAARMAEGAAALLLYAWLMFVVRSDDLAQHSSSWLTYLLIVALLAWIALTRRLARTHAGGRRFEENAVPADVRIPDS